MPKQRFPGVTPNNEFKALRENSRHQGYVVEFLDAYFEAPDGSEIRRDVVRHPGAVAAVVLDAKQNVTLVKQFRSAIGGDIWEIPAGKIDVAGEPLEDTVRRELQEEVGVAAAKLTPLAPIIHSAGFCDEVCHIFLATELAAVPDNREGPEEEAMTVEKVPLVEALQWVDEGRITDAKTVTGLLLTARRLGL